MRCYSSERKYGTAIGDSYTLWQDIIFAVSQQAILGPLLFNIFLHDLLFLMKDSDFASYDDNAP